MPHLPFGQGGAGGACYALLIREKREGGKKRKKKGKEGKKEKKALIIVPINLFLGGSILFFLNYHMTKTFLDI